MNQRPETVQVFIPLAIRKRNGRPRIVVPHTQRSDTEQKQQPHILRAIGRAWSWRRKLESGEVSTIYEIAKAEGVTDRYVSRMMRLAYLSPEVLQGLALERQAAEMSVKDLIEASYLVWHQQITKNAWI